MPRDGKPYAAFFCGHCDYAAERSGHIAASPSASVAVMVVRIMWRG